MSSDLLRDVLAQPSAGDETAAADRKPHWRTWAKRHVRPLLKRIRQDVSMPSEPHPYVACLVADGDRMGDFLERLHRWQDHQVVSRALSEFALSCRQTVEQGDYKGSLVYAGGDDVLAFVCVTDALACAEALRSDFKARMQRVIDALPEEVRPDSAPTLSVGIGIGHMLENMGDLLDLGREAERLAKGQGLSKAQQRNALGILLDKRSGGRHGWRASWDDDPVEQLDLLREVLADGLLSKGKIHEIGACMLRFPKVADMADASLEARIEWGEMARYEVKRILARTGGDGDGLTPDDVGLDLTQGEAYPVVRAKVDEWIERTLVALEFLHAQKGTRNEEETP